MCNSIIVILFVLLKLASSNTVPDEFSFNGCLKLDGLAEADPNGLLTLTTGLGRGVAHVFFNLPLQFKNSTAGSISSFSTTFVFAMVPEYPKLGGHGLAFVISPSKDIPGALPCQYLGLFNDTNIGNSSNHIIAVELDTVQDFEFDDRDDNHVGIDINTLISNISKTAGYFDDQTGTFHELYLKSGDPMQIWIEYNGTKEQLNVTIHPVGETRPIRPLLSMTFDLSPYILDFMYVGFSSATGLLASSQYILGWNFKMDGQAQDLEISKLPKIPQSLGEKKGSKKLLQIILGVTLSVAGLTLISLVVLGALFVSRKKKFMEILEDWEVQYGPHRFTYKDLFVATKGFKENELLGSGGFGRVYRGTLPSSNTKIAVKRISHDSRQGMREFLAEISTIGRLRHPNLVRLLGYCRRHHELFLVYDYMPNGSLEKCLSNKSNCTLDWSQRFKIIKDVASGLFYLHQQWVQVVIHRDIKPANVLLDNDMNGKLGDFGLARFCDHGNDPQTSNIAGTLGYIAPELARTGRANTSTDLYAFGIFMLEVVCGRRLIEPRSQLQDQQFLVDWILECWDRGTILDTVDSKLENRYVAQEVELVLKLGLLCSHPCAAARPSMSSVVQYLDGIAQLPDTIRASIIQAHTSMENSNQPSVAPDVSTERYSNPSLTFTESFASHGR
ncbi:L-type lectin-domain containing receptor kinase V.9-like [Durio zibethinus]|uniref:non-specific serine/threonine protein kinase n=1 Tax=Durio zibethinus TaxID=66656 RepID=A0A6P6A8B8_DURZI|nr:L-type lectin-domain containing receptor kinase V.9-like [Durio zibethinus]